MKSDSPGIWPSRWGYCISAVDQAARLESDFKSLQNIPLQTSFLCLEWRIYPSFLRYCPFVLPGVHPVVPSDFIFLEQFGSLVHIDKAPRCVVPSLHTLCLAVSQYLKALCLRTTNNSHCYCSFLVVCFPSLLFCETVGTLCFVHKVYSYLF